MFLVYFHYSSVEKIQKTKSNIVTKSDDEHLFRLAMLEQPKENEYLVFNEIVPLTIDLFWIKFLSDKAEYSFPEFFKNEGHTVLDVDKWQNGEQKSKTSKYKKRTLTLKIKVKGVPFINSSLCLIRYHAKIAPLKITMIEQMVTPDVPLGKCELIPIF